MNLSQQLHQIAESATPNWQSQAKSYLNPIEVAIGELAKLKSGTTAKAFKAAAKELPRDLRERLADLSESEKNRRERSCRGKFRLGDRVVCTSEAYPRLTEQSLAIVEFRGIWVDCVQESGAYCPALFLGDLELLGGLDGK